MTVKNITAAWNMADEIFPTDYIKNETASINAGYDVYYSTASNVTAWISDLGNRLEINLDNGETINIWIDNSSEDVEEVEEVEEVTESVNAVHAAAIIAKNMLPVAVENMKKIVLSVDGSTWNLNIDEQAVYAGLQRGETWLGGELVGNWCTSHGIKWAIIENVKISHYNHGGHGGHYIITAYVREMSE